MWSSTPAIFASLADRLVDDHQRKNLVAVRQTDDVLAVDLSKADYIVLSRPDRYGKTGWYGADPAVFAQLKSVIETGIAPSATSVVSPKSSDLGCLRHQVDRREVELWKSPGPRRPPGEKRNRCAELLPFDGGPEPEARR